MSLKFRSLLSFTLEEYIGKEAFSTGDKGNSSQIFYWTNKAHVVI